MTFNRFSKRNTKFNCQFYRGSTRVIISTLLLLAIFSFTKTLSFASVPELTIDPLEAKIGDPITVRLVVPGVSPDSVTWPPLGDKLGDFHILGADTASKKEVKSLGGAAITWTVAAYDTGKFSTGDLELSISGDIKAINGGEVFISTVLADSTGEEMRPLKAQAELPFTFMDFLKLAWPWAVGILLIVLAWFLVRKLKQRKKVGIDGKYEEPPVPPYDEAIGALRRLQRDNPLAKGDLKGYVSVLSEILKRLFERVHEAPVLEMTTWEIRRWLTSNQVKAKKEVFLAMLTDADMVKFAKGNIDKSRCDEMFRDAEIIVSNYKPVVIEPKQEKNSTEPVISEIESETNPAEEIGSGEGGKS